MIIDITRLVNRFFAKKLLTGIDRVSFEYMKEYSKDITALIRYKNIWYFLSKKNSLKIFKILVQNNYQQRHMIIFYCTQDYFLKTIKKNIEKEKFLNLSHSGLENPLYYKKIIKYNLSLIAFIHDLIPIRYPEYSGDFEKEKHEYRIQNILKTANKIIVNSNDTYLDLKNYAIQNNIITPKIITAHLGTNITSKNIINKKLLNEPYFVMIGTIEPRKNHWIILHIWRDLVNQYGIETPKLIIIGQIGWKNENVVSMLNECDKLKPFIIHEKSCNDTRLNNYISHSKALLFPSFCEGYGIPLIESISIGIPVIASDLKVFKELVNNIPEYISPLDAVQWKKMIMDYQQEHSPKRESQLKRISNFTPQTWEKHFNIVKNYI